MLGRFLRCMAVRLYVFAVVVIVVVVRNVSFWINVSCREESQGRWKR